MKTYKIYCHTINNKKYIGYTEKNIDERLEEHIKDSIKGSNTYFHRAIRKHGSDKIITEQLYECLIEEEVKIKETYYINYFDTFNNGYNMTKGGSGGNTKIKYSKFKMKKWGEKRKKLSAGMNNGNAKPNIQKENIIEEILNFVKKENKVGKNILRKEIDQFLKEKLNVSSTILKNRGIKNYSELIRLVNEKLGIANAVIYDPYYRSIAQKQQASYMSSTWLWITNGSRNIRIHEDEIIVFLEQNKNYRQGRSL